MPISSEPPINTEVQRQQWLDQEDAWMRETVRRHGWAVQAVLGEGCWGSASCQCGLPRGGAPPFAYTVGLYGFGHPELLVYGLPDGDACWVLNNLAERVRQGQRFAPGRVYPLDDSPRQVHLFAFHDDGPVPVLISAQRFYDRSRADPVPALQCVWNDGRGRFPWEPGYDLPAGLQPLPQSLSG